MMSACLSLNATADRQAVQSQHIRGTFPKYPVKTIPIIALSCLISLLACVSVEAQQPPNVVLIFVDDLGYGDVGCYGATKVKTPNIDQLAKEGRRFTDAHSASAVCTPSRYGLLTGQYPVRAKDGEGVWGPLSNNSGMIIDTEMLTIGKVFKNKGYATACLGKWHLGFKEGTNDWKVPLRPGPQDVGFDHYFGVPLVNSGSPYVYVEDDSYLGHDPDDPLVYGGKPISPTPTFPKEASRKSPNKFSGALEAHKIYDDEKTATLLTERAVKWITEKKDEPFFLYFPTPNIHHPFTPNPRFKGTSECGLYGDFIHELDWMVGEITGCLEKNGLSDNTLVIFTSDNGAMLNLAGRNAMKARHKINGDLLGFKFGVWEGGHRVPMIAKWPGNIEAGTESKQLIGHVDLLATFTALTEQDPQDLVDKDSINMLPAFLNQPDTPLRTELLLAPRNPRNLAIRKDKWMYIGSKGSGGFSGSKPNQHAWGGAPAVAFAGGTNSDIENGKIKKGSPPAQLYDLESDLLQTKNVVLENPKVADEMKALLNTWRPKKSEDANPKKRKPGNRKRKKDEKPEKEMEGAGKTSATSLTSFNRAVSSSVTAKAMSDRSKPNFVIIFTDDQGYGDLSCYGGTHVKTPRIDQMAAEGAMLTSFYVAAPVCTPSRAALMTGCYPTRIDMGKGSRHGVCLAGDRKGLNPDEVTIAEVLKSAGYATGMFGKWHLGDQPQFLPTKQGFDEFFGIPYSHDIHPFHPQQKRYKFPPLPLLENETVVEMEPDANNLTKRFTEKAVSFIERNRDTPFFLYVPHPIPHTPLHTSQPFMKNVDKDILEKLKQEDNNIDYETRKNLFPQAIAEIDWSVGQILDSLKANGLDENTLVIFTSDNGPPKNTKYASPGRLRGNKGTTLEGGMREPTVIRWPGKIPAGKPNDEVMTTMDLLPTFAKLAGAAIPTDRVIDGKDIWPTLIGEAETPHEAFFYHSGNRLSAVRMGKWKLHTKNGNPKQLFDLEQDLKEKTNLFKSHPEIVKNLNARLKAFAKEIAANKRPAGYVENPKPLSK